MRVMNVVRRLAPETFWMERTNVIFLSDPVTSSISLHSLKVATVRQASFHVTAHVRRLAFVDPLNTWPKVLCDHYLLASSEISSIASTTFDPSAPIQPFPVEHGHFEGQV